MKRVFTFVRSHPRAAAAAVVVIIAGVALFVAHLVIIPKNTIIEREDGFHPRTLTIKAGETVTFKSERGKYFWPASDFHPTHLLHPEFDPKKPINPHASWSFTFDKPGVFAFHDHLAAYYMGLIRVTDANGTLVDDCKQHGGMLECWQTQIFAALAEKGLDAAYDVVGTFYTSDPSFAGSCHYLSHNIGLATYQFYRHDPNIIYSTKAVSCAGGFYHGFMEGYIGATGDIKGAAALCDKIGTTIGDQVPDARLQCYHGIGHGSIETAIATTGSFEDIDSMVSIALKNCETASAGKDERYRCVSGMYNALANFYIEGQYGLSVKTSDPLALCARQQEVYKEACYGDMNSVVLWEGKNDLAKASAYVLAIKDPIYRAVSIKYLSGLVAVQYVGTTTPFTPVVTACRTLPGSYPTDCLRGFAHGLLEHGSPGIQYKEALAYCADPILTASERASCYTEVLGSLQGWYSKPIAAQICASVTPALQSYCKNSPQ